MERKLLLISAGLLVLGLLVGFGVAFLATAEDRAVADEVYKAAADQGFTAKGVGAAKIVLPALQLQSTAFVAKQLTDVSYLGNLTTYFKQMLNFNWNNFLYLNGVKFKSNKASGETATKLSKSIDYYLDNNFNVVYSYLVKDRLGKTYTSSDYLSLDSSTVLESEPLGVKLRRYKMGDADDAAKTFLAINSGFTDKMVLLEATDSAAFRGGLNIGSYSNLSFAWVDLCAGGCVKYSQVVAVVCTNPVTCAGKPYPCCANWQSYKTVLLSPTAQITRNLALTATQFNDFQNSLSPLSKDSLRQQPKYISTGITGPSPRWG